MTFAPRRDILPASQLALWPELSAVPVTFVLYGGTALALRLGHRTSIDFDFFSHEPLDHRELDGLPFVHGATVLQDQHDTRTVSVDRGGPVKVSFFGGIPFGRVGEPETTDDGILRVASLLDLGGTKVKALLQRVESKAIGTSRHCSMPGSSSPTSSARPVRFSDPRSSLSWRKRRSAILSAEIWTCSTRRSGTA